MTQSDNYRMSFSTGGLFINESVEVARLHEQGETWQDTIKRAMVAETTSLPKSASNRRTLREICNRLATLSSEELAFLTDEADRHEQQLLLWLAACRAYRFVREFAVEVLRERHLSYLLDLPLESFDQFFDAKAEWDDHLDSINENTRKKLRQVMFRMMREAAIISDDNKIQTTYVSPRLEKLFRRTNATEFAVFPGVTV
ncbi:DUF1819 family protein [Tateyamaria pelophila]|uniref:DUF1819 family protein n=1 Tax=Tateyamaria pelophila TaxID=328415 RepID=UPI001CBF61AA|nr:DUF1819 family protein [Tateyamaria pelophila]